MSSALPQRHISTMVFVWPRVPAIPMRTRAHASACLALANVSNALGRQHTSAPPAQQVHLCSTLARASWAARSTHLSRLVEQPVRSATRLVGPNAVAPPQASALHAPRLNPISSVAHASVETATFERRTRALRSMSARSARTTVLAARRIADQHVSAMVRITK